MLVRRVMGAARLARYPVEVMIGDLADPAAIATAMAGCDLVFNCAKGAGADAAARRAVDVDAVRHVVEAAARNHTRVVHVSTMAVYDLPRDGEVDERSRPAPGGDRYSDAKLEGERLALALGASHKVPVTVIQPTVVYGPYAGVHGVDILEELRTSRMILVDGGSGICNAVYVDDVVTALLLAATCDRAVGERFLISGPDHPSWREFFGGFERMLGVQRTLSLSEAEVLALWARSRRRPWLIAEGVRAAREDRVLRRRLLATREGSLLRRVAERILPDSMTAPGRWTRRPEVAPAVSPELPVAPLRPWLVHYLACKARVRIDKARDRLGYDPVFRLGDGMRLTEEWARWAGLVP